MFGFEKMKRRALALLLMLLVTMPSIAAGFTTYIKGDAWCDLDLSSHSVTRQSGNIYHIKSAKDLAWWAYKIKQEKNDNARNELLSATIYLDADIDLSGHPWQGIGENGSIFSGTFDGQGHTIRNMCAQADKNGSYGSGFFDRLLSGAKVQNVNFENCYADAGGSKWGASIVVGFLQKGNNNITIKNININNCKIKAAFRSGFVIGRMEGNGDIKCDNIRVTRCIFEPSQGGGYNIGGIVGGMNENNGNNVYITNCFVSYRPEKDCVLPSWSGGLVGKMDHNAEIHVDNCVVDVYNGFFNENTSGQGGVLGYYCDSSKPYISNTAIIGYYDSSSKNKYIGTFVGEGWGSNIVISECHAYSSGVNCCFGQNIVNDKKYDGMSNMTSYTYYSPSAYAARGIVLMNRLGACYSMVSSSSSSNDLHDYIIPLTSADQGKLLGFTGKDNLEAVSNGLAYQIHPEVDMVFVKQSKVTEYTVKTQSNKWILADKTTNMTSKERMGAWKFKGTPTADEGKFTFDYAERPKAEFTETAYNNINQRVTLKWAVNNAKEFDKWKPYDPQWVIYNDDEIVARLPYDQMGWTDTNPKLNADNNYKVYLVCDKVKYTEADNETFLSETFTGTYDMTLTCTTPAIIQDKVENVLHLPNAAVMDSCRIRLMKWGKELADSCDNDPNVLVKHLDKLITVSSQYFRYDAAKTAEYIDIVYNQEPLTTNHCDMWSYMWVVDECKSEALQTVGLYHTGVVQMVQADNVKFADLTATKGKYNDRVTLQWKVDNKNNENIHYVIYRKEYVSGDTSDRDKWPVVYETSSALNSFTYEDETLPGYVYRYCIRAYPYCEGTSSHHVYQDEASDIGFAASRGSVMGRITYNNGGNTVEGADVQLVPVSDDLTQVSASYAAYFSDMNQRMTLAKGMGNDFWNGDWTLQFLMRNDMNAASATYLTTDSPVGTIGMLNGREAIVVELEVNGEKQKVGIATMNVGATSVDDCCGDAQSDCYGSFFTSATANSASNGLSNGWYVPTKDQMNALLKRLTWNNERYGVEWKIGSNTLFIPAAGYYYNGNKSVGKQCVIWTKPQDGHSYRMDMWATAGQMYEGATNTSTGAKLRPFCELPASGTTIVEVPRKGRLVQLPTGLTLELEEGNIILADGQKVSVEDGTYEGNYIVVTHDSKGYRVGKVVRDEDTRKGTLVMSNAYDKVAVNRPGAIVFGGFTGGIDEVRLWKGVLSDKSIGNTYDRYLSGNEKGLMAYYTFDSGVSEFAFDLSHPVGTWNNRHVAMPANAPIISPVFIPENDVLCYRGTTDANGEYTITGIPFVGEGTNYDVYPRYGLHDFLPVSTKRYISQNSLLYSDVNFSDVSSFEMRGTVYYENTNYPVQGCHVLIDGQTVVDKDGFYETDQYGRFCVQVPIGTHTISLEKAGHTFTSELTHYFNKPLVDVNFYDDTKVTVAGRVAGGRIETDKPLGFGVSKANIGQARITLSVPASSGYYFTARHAADGIGFEASDGPVEYANASARVSSYAVSGMASENTAGKIYITTDDKSGEYAVMLPPIQYVIDKIETLQTHEYDKKLKEMTGFIDARNAEIGYTDSVIIENETQFGWQKFDYQAYNKFMVTTPSEMHVTQVKPTAEGYLGEAGQVMLNQNRDTVKVDYFKDGKYTIGIGDVKLPVFKMLSEYRLKIAAFQKYQYMDGDSMVVDEVPLQGYGVSVSNQMASTNYVTISDDGDSQLIKPESEGSDLEEIGAEDVLTLDENGEVVYAFKAGFPNTVSPFTHTMTFTLDDSGNTTWSQQGIVFGYIPYGNEFYTEGPSEVQMILRDPPGSQSTATWTAGTSVTKIHETTDIHETGLTEKMAESFGKEEVTITGANGPQLVLKQMTISDKAELTEEFSDAFTDSYTSGHTTVTTTTRNISTSSARGLDGPDADIFVGSSYNQVIGRAWDVNIYEEDGHGGYNVGRKDIGTHSLRFKTDFVYTQYHIKNVEIPRLRSERRRLILTPEDPVPPMDGEYHYRLTDRAWADLQAAATDAARDSIWDDEDSYEYVEYAGGMRFDPAKLREGLTEPIDSVDMFGTWITNWKNQLSANERTKVKAIADSKGKEVRNFSIDGSSKMTFSETNSRTEILNNNDFSNATTGNVTVGNALYLFGKKVKSTTTERYKYTIKSRNVKNEKNDTIFSYTLYDGDLNDALSVDVLTPEDNYGAVFYTRAGQTSGYWEPQRVAEFYEPEQKHEIMAPTLRVNKPHLKLINTVDGVENVDVITGVRAGGKAYVKFEIMNDSEAKVKGKYTFGVTALTNEGALSFKANGAVLNNVTYTLDYQERDTILVEIQQTDPSILDHRVKFWLAAADQTASDAGYAPNWDEQWVTIHFQEKSSEVDLAVNHTVVNKKVMDEGGKLAFRLHDYDNKMKGLKYIELQKWQDNDWKTVSDGRWTFNPDFAGAAILLADADVEIRDTIDITNSVLYPDGEMKFRARTVSNFGGEDTYAYSDVITIIKDVVAPQQMGNVSPANGIYNYDSEVSLTFNEDIVKELINPATIHLMGDLNDGKVTHEVSLLCDGGKGYETESKVALPNSSMSINTWLKLTGAGGSILAHGTSNRHMSVGVSLENDLFYVKVGDKTYSSDKVLPRDEWIFLSVVFNGEGSNGPTVSAECDTENHGHIVLLNEQPVEGALSVSSAINVGHMFNGYIHGLSLWDNVRPYEKALAEKNKAHGKFTPHLLAYWPLDEGHGSVAANKVDGSNLMLGDSHDHKWHIEGDNYSLRVNAGEQVELNTSVANTGDDDDYMLQFWFRRSADADPASDGEEERVFSLGEGHSDVHLAFDGTNGSLHLVGLDSTKVVVTERDMRDDQWHQFSMMVNKSSNANAIIYLDGMKVAQMASSKIANLGEMLTFGGGGFSGYIDEVRGWHGSYDADLISKVLYTRFNPDNAQVTMYYPFERKVRDENNVLQYQFCDLDLGSIYVSEDSRPHAQVKGHPFQQVSHSTTIAPPLRSSSELQSLKFDIVASERRITLDITEAPERIEGCVIAATVSGIQDKAGNEILPVCWTFVVQHDFLQWQAPDMTRSFFTSAFEDGGEVMLSATIHNNTGTAREWSLDGVPAWMEASLSSGTLNANESKVITFKVNKSIGIGNHVGSIYLMETNGISHKLGYDVTYQAIQPEWAVNAADYETTMSIIGQVKLDGVIRENPNSIIAAFNSSDECIGLCKPEYLSRFGAYYYMMTVYGNKNGDKTVNFRFYNAETGIIHPSVSVDDKYDVSFAENKVLGSVSDPLLWYPDDKIEQNIDLRRGWNWISFNIVGNDSVKNVFTDYIVPVEDEAHLIQIVNEDSFTKYEDGEFNGTLSQITTGTMYKVQMDAPAILKRVGEPVNGIHQAITIHENWNWLGANVSSQLSLDAAMADMNPTEGDVIKNRTELAMFTGGGWVGTLKQIEPGVGYFYNSGSSAEKNFVYPTSASQTEVYNSKVRLAAATRQSSSFNAYTGTMTMVAAIESDGKRLGDCELQAVDLSGELRGVNVTQDADGRHLIYIVLHGDNPETLSFRVIKRNAGEVIASDLVESVMFGDGESIGKAFDPFIFSMDTLGITNILTSDTNAPLYDLSGRRILKAPKQGIYIQQHKKILK